ncbi:Pyridoxamine 5'-phosphate oxidase [Roseimaritima multifibrata]|uniref:Pyridoxamine 5'-phosphate oxidase n=1 Tax=Roseimaritima multifibrata TaxID=1930274 RepID=A0A517MHD8_9BACT|nr:pyridoxamine 5'-phosphate oxidase family protein [Roseimaritima multifibrata]QDS94291.1 Pyridoxamine 5'-phosphate oxidase [Roseimaritima multifibrata]
MESHEKLVSLMEHFDTAMLVTNTVDGKLEGRPMAVADLTDSGELWFVTDRHSGKVAEMVLDSEVAITMQGSSRFVSITGKASLVDDPAKINELWSEAWKVWFPKGKNDPSITLIKVTPERGEYWDNSGFSGIQYMIKAGKAYIQGKPPEKDEAMNASVTMQ